MDMLIFGNEDKKHKFFIMLEKTDDVIIETMKSKFYS